MSVETLMGSDPHILSRKILRSVRGNIEKLKCDRFDEHDVKELLIDLREVGRYFVKNLPPEERNQFTKAFQDFIDVCDFIAHSNREWGIIERNVRQHVKKLHEMISTATMEEFTSLPVDNVIYTDALVSAMLGFAFYTLSAQDKSITSEYFLDAFKNKGDIALCLLSLLQDSIIKLDKDEGFAILFILSFEGRYRLYCQILESRIEREARERTGGTGRLVLGFPVIVSLVPCIDDIPSEAPQGLPAVFETFRDAENKLRMRAF